MTCIKTQKGAKWSLWHIMDDHWDSPGVPDAFLTLWHILGSISGVSQRSFVIHLAMNQGIRSHTHIEFPAHHVDLECNAVCDTYMGHRIFCTFYKLVMDTNMQSRESQDHRSPVQGMLRICESILHIRFSGFAKAAAAREQGKLRFR